MTRTRNSRQDSPARSVDLLQVVVITSQWLVGRESREVVAETWSLFRQTHGRHDNRESPRGFPENHLGSRAATRDWTNWIRSAVVFVGVSAIALGIAVSLSRRLIGLAILGAILIGIGTTLITEYVRRSRTRGRTAGEARLRPRAPVPVHVVRDEGRPVLQEGPRSENPPTVGRQLETRDK
jgi:hypothetical protein